MFGRIFRGLVAMLGIPVIIRLSNWSINMIFVSSELLGPNLIEERTSIDGLETKFNLFSECILSVSLHE